jgi:hypothetical protein
MMMMKRENVFKPKQQQLDFTRECGDRLLMIREEETDGTSSRMAFQEFFHLRMDADII